MNILHINNFHYMRGGSEIVYFKTAELLESHGHKSIFFSVKHPQTLPCETEEYFVQYFDLSAKQFINQLKIAGRILYNVEARKRLSILLDKYPVDIAHVHNIYHHLSPSILYELKKRNIPIVKTIHDYNLICAAHSLMIDGKICEACHGKKYINVIKNKCVKNSLTKSMLGAIEMYLHHRVTGIYRKMDIFISPSQFLRDKMYEMGFKNEIVYLPNFINIQRFNRFYEDRTKGVNGKRNTIIFFGRLSREKGAIVLVEAAKLLSKNTSRNIAVKIIGEGIRREVLEQKIRKEGIKNVSLIGYMSEEDLFNELIDSVAVVVPSLWYENNPLSILESFTIGIPVIGSRIGGIPELVKDNEKGLTFEPGNAADLAEKIEYMLDNPDAAKKMGKNARRFMEDELNAERHYQKLMEIYKRAIEINKKS